MNNLFKRIFGLLTVVLFSTALGVFAQSSGGVYTVSQSVIGNGGGASSDAGSLYKVEGTGGQAVAGTGSSGGTYGTLSGFWSPNPLAPTAAAVSLSGRVVKPNKAAISGAIVVLTGGNLTSPRVVKTNNFGNFRFDEIEAGQVYVITVSHRRFDFMPDSQIFMVMDSLGDVNFVAALSN